MTRIDYLITKINNDDLSLFTKLVNRHFDGNLYQLSRLMEKIIYMLHYLPEDEFSEKEKRNISFLLWQIKESLSTSFFEQQSKQDRFR